VSQSAPVIELYRPVLLVGRHPECDVRIDSPKVSRRHCCFATAYDRILIRDLGSRNGVRVNGQLLEEARLQPGDELAIGPIIFRLEEAYEEQPPAQRRPAPGAGRPPGPVEKGPWQGPLSPGAIKPDSDADLVPIDDI
jgi:pSer/pThr/pTyr-binding forkhead associated (FHA) protein